MSRSRVAVWDFHRRLPGYAPTPLVELPRLARGLGLGRLYTKLETDRFGLPAFKVLGVWWAVARTLVEDAASLEREDWRQRLAERRPLELLAATDGNHGRAVARVAAELGLAASIWIPASAARGRVEAIRAEGAKVTLVEGTYDEAVARAAAESGPRALLVQDMAWEGYDLIPRRIVAGYSTLLHEIDEQLADGGLPPPESVFVPVGVGSLASAVVDHYAGRRSPVRVVGVEPESAACAARSLIAGGPVNVPGPHDSIMAGLNCGRLSSAAWPRIRDGLAGVAVVSDTAAELAVRELAGQDVAVGESGGAALAGLNEVVANRGLVGSSALLLCTEGVTDLDGYRRIVGPVC